MPKFNVTPEIQTSPVYRIRGQHSKVYYPDPKVSPETCQKIRDVNISERGAAIVRRGYEDYSGAGDVAGSEAVTGMIQENFSTGQARIFTTPTKVYLDDGTTRDDITGSLTLTVAGDDDHLSYVFVRDKIIATNGKDEIWTKDNDNTTPSNAAALSFDSNGVTMTACEGLALHRNTVIAWGPTEGGTKYPTRIRWSDINTRTFLPDETLWPDNNRIEIYADGGDIISCQDNFGRLLVFKEDGLYPGRIEYDVGYIEFRLDETAIQRGFSPISKSMVTRPEFVFGVASEGCFIILPDMSFRIVTDAVRDVWYNEINRARLSKAVCYVRERDHQVRVLLSKSGTSAGFDLIMVWDWDNGEISFEEPSTTISFARSIDIASAERDWMGTAAGKLYTGNIGTQDDGVDFNWSVEMNPNDLGHPGKTKTIHTIRTIFKRSTSQGVVNLLLQRNEGRLPAPAKEITLVAPNTWNDGVTLWNDGTKWNDEINIESRFFVNRQAETIAPKWTGSAPATLVGYQCEFSIEE